MSSATVNKLVHMPHQPCRTAVFSQPPQLTILTSMWISPVWNWHLFVLICISLVMSVVKCIFKCSRTVVYVFLRTVHAFAYFSVEFLVSFLRALYIYIYMLWSEVLYLWSKLQLFSHVWCGVKENYIWPLSPVAEVELLKPLGLLAWLMCFVRRAPFDYTWLYANRGT